MNMSKKEQRENQVNSIWFEAELKDGSCLLVRLKDILCVAQGFLVIDKDLSFELAHSVYVTQQILKSE